MRRLLEEGEGVWTMPLWSIWCRFITRKTADDERTLRFDCVEPCKTIFGNDYLQKHSKPESQFAIWKVLYNKLEGARMCKRLIFTIMLLLLGGSVSAQDATIHAVSGKWYDATEKNGMSVCQGDRGEAGSPLVISESQIRGDESICKIRKLIAHGPTLEAQLSCYMEGTHHQERDLFRLLDQSHLQVTVIGNNSYVMTRCPSLASNDALISKPIDKVPFPTPQSLTVNSPPPQETPRPSFSCNKARTLDEIAICSDARLAELDRLRDFDFQQAKHNDPQQAVQIARSILTARSFCGNDRVCILDVLTYADYPGGSPAPNWVESYRKQLIHDVLKDDLRAKSNSLVGRRSSFPLSAKGVEATLAQITGVDTDHAFAIGQITAADQLEYCERDPGGETGQYGGKLTNQQCVVMNTAHTKQTDFDSFANCLSKTVTLRDGTWRILSYDDSAFTWLDPKSQVEKSWNGTAAVEAQFELLCPNSFAHIRADGFDSKQSSVPTSQNGPSNSRQPQQPRSSDPTIVTSSSSGSPASKNLEPHENGAGQVVPSPKVLRTTSIPSTAISDPEGLLKAVMREFYGTFSQTKVCWITKRADETDCMKPYKMDIIGADNNRRLFIVIAGQKLDDDGTPQESHVSSGVLGLIVLSENGAQLDVVATNGLYEDFGSFGSVPPVTSFTIHELGPNGSYGWIIQDKEFGNGEEVDFNQLYAVIGDTITSIGSIPARFTDSEAHCYQPCSNYSIDLLIDPTAQNARFYSLILRTSGIKDGQAFNKTYRVPFDTSSFKYLPPHEIE